MIIQCDQCKTKFRLDDSRVTESGVKVRCSRCKNTFIVRKQANEEGAGLSETEALAGNALKTENQLGSSAGMMHGQNAASPGDENESGRESGSVSQETGALGGASLDDKNDFAFEGFDTGFGAVADQAGEVAGAPGQQWVPEENQEDHGALAGYDLSDAMGKGPTGSDTGAIRLGIDGLPGTAENDFSGADFTGSPDSATSPAEFSTRSEDSEDVSNQSWDMFSTESGLPSKGSSEADEEEFSIGWQEQEPANDNIDSVKKEDHGVFAPASSQAEIDASSEHNVSAVEPEKDDGASLGRLAFAGEGSGEEDLPPLSISSRKKNSMLFPFAATILLMVVAAGGAAYYFSWIDFSSLKLPVLSGIAGRGATNSGCELSIKNLDGAYIRNINGSQLLVVTGETFNQSGKPLSSVEVKGYVYGKKGEVLLSRPAKFVNTLSRDQLTTLPVGEIEVLLKNGPGKSPDNAIIRPGAAASFQIVFTHVPANAGEFGAEVTGSKVSGR